MTVHKYNGTSSRFGGSGGYLGRFYKGKGRNPKWWHSGKCGDLICPIVSVPVNVNVENGERVTYQVSESNHR